MKLICYGDSNTYGYDGRDPFGGRLPENARWPELLGMSLGCECFNCGLNGRRVPRFHGSVEADVQLLRRFGDRALIIVLLGTNDLLCGASAEDTAAHMEVFLDRLTQAMPESAVLLCAPPPAFLDGEDFCEEFQNLVSLYAELAERKNLIFLDTSTWNIPLAPDGVHFSAQGHRLFAMKMTQSLRALLA